MGCVPIADQILQNQDKDGMLRRSLEINVQLYTDKSHFVYELLQNAEDAGATDIMFIQYQDRLVVLHDGCPFSAENLQALCDIGKSDKINDLNQIGKFGVGFKSVFGICESVKLYSHPSAADQEKGFKQFAIEIKDFTHPADIKDQDFDKKYTTMFVFPYSAGLSFSGFKTIDELNTAISNRLQNLGITTLLFMKSLRSIDYRISLPKIQTAGSYQLEKKEINDHCLLVSAVGETSEKRKKEEISYLVFSSPVYGFSGEKTNDIAFAVTVDENGEYTFKEAKSPYISVYFPTETESKLKFIVQGPYRTTPNRSSVPSDDKDNQILADQAAILLHESAQELRDTGKLNLSFLKILPVNKAIFENAPLFKCMYEETESMMKEEELLICKDGTYAKADSVKIARGAEFAKVMTEELLTELLNDGKTYHWLPTLLTETNRTYKELYDFFTGVLNIDVIRPENLRNAFNANKRFLKRRDDEWLVKMYNMYASVAAAFSKQKGGTNMLTAEFIKTTKGTFVAPYRKSDGADQNDFGYDDYENETYLPNVFLPTQNPQEMEDIYFVDDYVLKKCRHFFTEILNLKKPNEYEFFIRSFKKRCEDGGNISDDQHVTDLKRLLYYQKNTDYKDEVDSLIKKYLRLRCTKDGNRIFVNPSREKVFFPITSEGLNIEQYYAFIVSYPYVDADFYKIEGVTGDMLKELGVLDDISVNMDQTSGYEVRSGRRVKWNTYNDFRWKLSLDKFDEVINYISSNCPSENAKEKSRFIFQFLQNNESKLKGSVYYGGSTPDRPNEYSEIVDKLRFDGPKYKYYGMKWKGKWLYTESYKQVSQKEITKRDLNRKLYGDARDESKLYDILGFAKSEEEKLEEAAEGYDQLDDETKDRFLEIELRRRFGISISDLEQNYGSGAAEGTTLGGYMPKDTDEFPSVRVRNWDSLRKHVAEVLVFSSPVKYEYKVLQVRVSRPDREIEAYLRSMYKVDGAYEYACQMCHEFKTSFEKCQLSTKMDKELDAMYLCMCPNCAKEYREMRSNENILKPFISKIRNLEDYEINSSDPVKIYCGSKSIWFTQTHVAEIRELMALKDAADNYRKTSGSAKNQSKNAEERNNKNLEEGTFLGTDVYKEYIGKRVYHQRDGYGVVKACDGEYMDIELEESKDVKQYSLEACLSKGFIKIVEETEED